MSTSRPVVYTAIAAGYDHLLAPPHAATNAADFVAFLEEPCASPLRRSHPIHRGFGEGRVGGHRALPWSERRQREMMRACKAAFDVKHTALFSQRHKPPTKGQQYVASGIPCALNPESYSAEYFRRRGFDPA